MLGVFEAREVAERADICKIHFGGFDEPLPDIGKVRAQYDYLVGGFEYGEPGFDCVDRHAEVSGDIGQVQELGTSAGQDSQEILILGQVPNLSQRTHIPLEDRSGYSWLAREMHRGWVVWRVLDIRLGGSPATACQRRLTISKTTGARAPTEGQAVDDPPFPVWKVATGEALLRDLPKIRLLSPRATIL